jgi:hypothetical protein
MGETTGTRSAPRRGRTRSGASSPQFRSAV